MYTYIIHVYISSLCTRHVYSHLYMYTYIIHVYISFLCTRHKTYTHLHVCICLYGHNVLIHTYMYKYNVYACTSNSKIYMHLSDYEIKVTTFLKY